MNKIVLDLKQRGFTGALFPRFGMALVLLLCAQNANSASISGRAVDTDGVALTKVSICLSLASSPSTCERVRWTDKKGAYTFNGLKPGIDFILTVNGDSTVSNRKFEQHANYAWQPREHRATINSKNEKL